MTSPGTPQADAIMFPDPVGDYHNDYAALPTGFRAVYGHHARYCNHDQELRRPGVSVAEHGLWCERQVAGVNANFENSHDDQIWVCNVRPYQHGVYQTGYFPRDLVCLFGPRDEDEPPWATLIPSAARSLVAALLHAADEAEFGHLRNGGAGR
ncbi:hypothetical protein [Micropruina sp.]|uniref:hypothetical protein n=1 Tax=Micropruina sp. TaxID=2737536 RepID=UPI0039E5691C